MQDHTINCDCQSVSIILKGEPMVSALCHCESCRQLHNVPFVAITAWKPEHTHIQSDTTSLKSFKYPGKELVRWWCSHCGSMLYNTNRFGFIVVPQMLLRKAHNGELPEELMPKKHLFYADRLMDIDDDLPKYLEGTDGPLYQANT